jgi:hypothetical protein
MANTKLLHLDSYNTSSKKKIERLWRFSKYVQVEVVEVHFLETYYKFKNFDVAITWEETRNEHAQ